MSTETETLAVQPLLFDSLPAAAPARRIARRPRRSAAEPVAMDTVQEPAPARMLVPVPPPAPAPAAAPEPFDPAALTNPELRALVQALPDLRLAFLAVEAARELKRRLAPEPDDEDGTAAAPNPSLLRAARLIVGELSGEDI